MRTHHELHDAMRLGCTEANEVLNANDACCPVASLYIRGKSRPSEEKKWRHSVGLRYTFAFEGLGFERKAEMLYICPYKDFADRFSVGANNIDSH